MTAKPTLPFDPFALAQASGEFAMSLASRPQDLLQVQMEAARQWGDFWTDALTGRRSDGPILLADLLSALPVALLTRP